MNIGRSLRVRRCRQGLVGIVAAVCLPLAGCGGSTQPGTAQPVQSTGGALDISVPPDVMDLPLVDSAGHTTSLAALKGKVVVVNDVLTLCQETCPLDTANLVQAAGAVEKAGLGDKVEFLSITIDPQRDTIAQLAAYRNLFAPPPADWATLTGKPSDLAALWKDLGVWIEKVGEDGPPPKNWRTGAPLTYDLDHSDNVFFIGGGREQALLQGPGHVLPGTRLPKTLNTFMDDDGHHNLAHPGTDAWTTDQVLQTISRLTHHPISAPH